MKKYLALFLVIFPFLMLHSQDEERYSRVRISLEGKDISSLAQTGIDVTKGFYKSAYFLETDLSASEISRIKASDFKVQMMIEDVSQFYSERAAAEAELRIYRNPADEFPVPENWEYGSMGGFYTYDEVLAKLDFMTATWPEFVSERQIIDPDNLTINGNPLWWIKISNDAKAATEKPQVLYTSLIHSREGIGVQHNIYFMLWLLENYETNYLAKTIVDNYDLYFIPIVNPDGYLHNQQTNPNGGGMWRKNRRNNGNGAFGVDLNRNFGYYWGYDNIGSSPDPTSETYRGIAGFSEVETQTIRKFVEEHEFKIALNYHSYSNLLLYPWGWTTTLCDDDAIFSAYSEKMTRDNNYVYGPSSVAIYPTNGGSDDYMYGDTEFKNAIFAYTPEVGSNIDGFWPSISRIIPLCQENMIQSIYAALFSGSYGMITDKTNKIVDEKDFFFVFDLQRYGLTDTEQWQCSIEPLDDRIESVSEPITFGSLDVLESKTDSIHITLNPSILSGQNFRFLLKIDNGKYIQIDTITKMYGFTSIVFEDDCSSLNNWTPGNWGLSSTSYVSAPSSITDSPNGNYPNNSTNIITLTNPISLPETSYIELNFWAKWNIELGWDYAQASIKPASSASWIPLEGKHTKTGNSYQSLGKPIYDGISDWVLEEIDLSAYAGEDIQLQFKMVSDVYVNADGFYFDDLSIICLDIETGLEEKEAVQQIRVYPNPARNKVTISTSAAFTHDTKVDVVDMTGKTIMEVDYPRGTTSIQLQTSALNQGVYFVRTRNGGTVTKLIIH